MFTHKKEENTKKIFYACKNLLMLMQFMQAFAPHRPLHIGFGASWCASADKVRAVQHERWYFALVLLATPWRRGCIIINMTFVCYFIMQSSRRPRNALDHDEYSCIWTSKASTSLWLLSTLYLQWKFAVTHHRARVLSKVYWIGMLAEASRNKQNLCLEHSILCLRTSNMPRNRILRDKTAKRDLEVWSGLAPRKIRGQSYAKRITPDRCLPNKTDKFMIKFIMSDLT